MTEVEANSIPEAIGGTALQDMYMEVVEQDPGHRHSM